MSIIQLTIVNSRKLTFTGSVLRPYFIVPYSAENDRKTVVHDRADLNWEYHHPSSSLAVKVSIGSHLEGDWMLY